MLALKGKGWVRDLWLLKSHWAESDFMLHAVKEKALLTLRPEIKNMFVLPSFKSY